MTEAKRRPKGGRNQMIKSNQVQKGEIYIFIYINEFMCLCRVFVGHLKSFDSNVLYAEYGISASYLCIRFSPKIFYD